MSAKKPAYPRPRMVTRHAWQKSLRLAASKRKPRQEGA